MEPAGIFHAIFARSLKSAPIGLFLCMLLVSCSSETPQTAVPPPLVSVYTVSATDVDLTSDYVAQAVGSLAVQVRAQVGGILKQRNYVEGDYVQQGQILFEIEPETYQAAYDQAQAGLAQAAAALDQKRREWNRIQPLYAQNAVSQRDRDTAQTAYNGAEADYQAAQAVLEEARIKLDYAYVKAPISGYTSKESWTEGNLISTTGDESLLTVINQIDPIFIDFAIPSADVARARRLISDGRATRTNTIKAYLRFMDGSVYKHEGTVTFIDTRVEASTSVIRSRAVFANPDRIILPGQFARLTIWGITLREALLIPQSAVLQTQQGSLVMVLDENNKPSVRKVEIETQNGIGNRFVATSGLRAGERIIAEGVNKVREGQDVRIQAPVQPAPQDGASMPDVPAEAATHE